MAQRSPVEEVIGELTKFVNQAQGIFVEEEYVQKVKQLLPPLINSNLTVDTGIFDWNKY